MSEEKSYSCRECEEKDVSKFYNKRYNICKSCYSKKMSLNKEKAKEEFGDIKKRVEFLEKSVEEILEELQVLKMKKTKN